jgi:hypothetical protein
VGLSQVDITPPVGIYHPFWGAAVHHQATGVHRPLLAGVLIMAPLDEADEQSARVYVTIDHCLLRPQEMDSVLTATSRLTGVPGERMTFTFSHTHSGGHLSLSRAELPGGELIGPYLDELPGKIASAFREAESALQPVVLTYGWTVCNMGRHRDYWDDELERYVCGYNPEASLDLPLGVMRITDDADRLVGTAVNYPCHPTTLAWQNTLSSPDYIGALRETIEQTTDAPCLFLLSPCGDIGPRHGYVGDVEVADGNGRQVAFAALGLLESLPPQGTDSHYAGAVLSGATLGTWEYRPQTPERNRSSARFRQQRLTVPIRYLDGPQSVSESQARLDELLAQENQATEAGDQQQARDIHAMVERQRRLLDRISPLPPGETYPYTVDITQLGDTFWISVEGEPYHWLQQELLRRFPETPLVFITLAGGSRCSYLPTREDYAKPLYQAEIALLEPGALETVTEAIAVQIREWWP